MAPRTAAFPTRSAPRTDGLADFIHEMASLAEHLGPKERAVLLDLAHKLSGR
jgi:hypothetical protein